MAGPLLPAQPGKKIRLLVLYGGRSAEHDVSCTSAFHVVNAINTDRYDLRLVGITRAGEWMDTTASAPLPPGAKALPSPDAMAGDQPDGPSGAGSAEPVEIVRAGSAGSGQGDGPVVVLPLLHGPMGEDGTVQGLLEVAGVAYCGAGVAGSAAAMDKGMAKALLASAGLPQAKYVFIREAEIEGRMSELTARVEGQLGWPVFVKPANMGSSIGISQVKDPGGLGPALEQARLYDEFFVIEEAVRGRELEMGVLGWPELRTSVPGEVKPSHAFYDFEDKYLDGSAGLEVPARLPAGVAEEMSRLAVAACQALRVDSMARVDFFFEEGGRGLLINEINTIPGFTPISMYPQMWAASGVSYPALVDALVGQALTRAGRRARFETHRT
jgi:D-alanine-D-alanine ligase